MSKAKQLHIRDKKIADFYEQMNASLAAGHTATKQQNWAEALLRYEQASETTQLAIAYCEKSKKRAYISNLESFFSSLLVDRGRSLRHLGRIDECLDCYEKAYRGGQTERLDDLFVVAHNAKRFKKALGYILIKDKYKTVHPAVLYDYAVRLSREDAGLEQDFELSLKFFLFLFQRMTKSLPEVLAAAKEKDGFFEEKIAQVYCELKDTPKELEWRLKAVQKQYPMALHNYAEMLNDGQGVKKDAFQALRYHQQAAEAGHLSAMLACAIHYSKSEEIPFSYVQALHWLRCAFQIERSSRVACNYYELLFNQNIDDLDSVRDTLDELMVIIEAETPDAAKSIRAIMLAHDPKSDQNQIMQAAEILQELSDEGHANSQYSLAIIYEKYPYFSRTMAVSLYLDAISNGEILARNNLFILMQKLSVEMANDLERLLAIFKTVERRYRLSLPKKQRKTDKVLGCFSQTRTALEQGIEGNITEFFKTLFPEAYGAINAKIISISSNITATARDQTSTVSDKIANILEISRSFDSTNRARTCAFRRIAEVVGASPQGLAALMKHQEGFDQLRAQIVEGTLDNEAYIELAVGLAKFKVNPRSRLIEGCYQKLYQYHGQDLRLGHLSLTHYQSAMLLSAMSDMPVSDDQFHHSLEMALKVVCRDIPLMNSWQLLKTLQAVCVIHAYHAQSTIQNHLPKLFEELFKKITDLKPNELSMIDCYQLYLCLNYIDKIKLESTKAARDLFRTRFSALIVWLKNLRTTISQSQLWLTEFLRSYRSDVFSEKYINGLYADIWLKNINVVIEFDGRFHFMDTLPGEDLPLVRVTRDCYHEVILGVRVVRLIYKEFDSLNQDDRQEVENFLQKMLATAGVVLCESVAVSEKNAIVAVERQVRANKK